MNFKYNTKQRKRTIQGLRSFKDTLPTNVKKIFKKKGDIYSKTLDNWKYIVGSEFFKVCYPKSISSSNKFKGSCLNIMVKRGCEVDLHYSKNNIIKKINTFFGYSVVENIKLNTFESKYEKKKEIKQRNATKSKYLSKIKDIKNDKVKNSLIELNNLIKKK
tara:strand:+ start:168 stop:650 length:483 start_codon:yes stop_codon:yes gene_type:complete